MKMLKINFVASSVVLASSVIAGQAQAFDTIDWNWDADVQSTVTTTATATTDLLPEGLTQVESVQDAFGTITALSDVDGIINTNIVVTTGNPDTDLAIAESAATSVGNNTNIESDVSVQLDNSQTYAGLDASLGLDPLAVNVLLPGAVTATSTAVGAINTSIDSNATAMSNSMALDLTTTSAEDAFAVTNSEQLSVALVTASSLVTGAAYTGFIGLSNASVPQVNSAATAVGNNLNVKVDGAF